MKKHLVIKTSSMGDIIHTLPALTDAGRADPAVRFDWVVEEGFSEIPTWHPLVDRVIPVAWRRWRRQPLRMLHDPVWRAFYRSLRDTEYDKVIDAQGLMKSAVLMRLSRGIRCGLDYHSAREGCATLAAQRRYAVAREQHAVVRTRQLFSRVLGYPLSSDPPDYGLDARGQRSAAPVILFIHGTSRADKYWPEEHWIALGRQCMEAGYTVKILWGSMAEHQRSLRIAAGCPEAVVLPKLSLGQVAQQLAQAHAAVAVDTGLGHMAAALALPTISLYGPTDPERIGALGAHQVHMRTSAAAEAVFARLSEQCSCVSP